MKIEDTPYWNEQKFEAKKNFYRTLLPYLERNGDRELFGEHTVTLHQYAKTQVHGELKPALALTGAMNTFVSQLLNKTQDAWEKLEKDVLSDPDLVEFHEQYQVLFETTKKLVLETPA